MALSRFASDDMEANQGVGSANVKRALFVLVGRAESVAKFNNIGFETTYQFFENSWEYSFFCMAVTLVERGFQQCRRL